VTDSAATQKEAATQQEAAAVGPRATLLWHSAYSDSILVREALEKHKVELRLRDVYELPLRREEIDALLEGFDDLRPFLNPRSTEYRDRGLDQQMPDRETLLELLAREPYLLRLPILLRRDAVRVCPFPEDALSFFGIETKRKRPVRKRRPAKKAAKKAVKKAVKKAATAPKPAAAKKA